MSEQLGRLEERTRLILSSLNELRKEVALIRKSDVRIAKLEQSQRLLVWLIGTFGLAVITVAVERVFH